MEGERSFAEGCAISLGPHLRRVIDSPDSTKKEIRQAKELLNFIQDLLLLQMALEVAGVPIFPYAKKGGCKPRKKKPTATKKKK